MSYSMRKKFLYAYRRRDGTTPRRSVTMNGEPILWKSQIRHLGNFITHDLSDLNDITFKKGVFTSQVNRLNARFPFVSSGVKGHLQARGLYVVYCVASGNEEKVQACLVTLWLFIISCHSLCKTTLGSLCS